MVLRIIFNNPLYLFLIDYLHVLELKSRLKVKNSYHRNIISFPKSKTMKVILSHKIFFVTLI